MAAQSITSLLNQHPHFAQEEGHGFDWEVVVGEDLYHDVESLDSFSVSSSDEKDGEEREFDGVRIDRSGIRGCCDDFEGLEGDLASEEHSCGCGVIPFGDCVVIAGDLDGEERGRDVALVDSLGFCIAGGELRVWDLGSSGLDWDAEMNGLSNGAYDDEEVNDGFISDQVAPLHCTTVMFARSDGCFGGNILDQISVLNGWDAGEDDDRDNEAVDHDSDDHGDCEHEIGVDDELVPWGVANRLEKQRMRKLGKRAFSKMNKSKKMAHLCIKPACLNGKYGLGLKTY